MKRYCIMLILLAIGTCTFAVPAEIDYKGRKHRMKEGGLVFRGGEGQPGADGRYGFIPEAWEGCYTSKCEWNKERTYSPIPFEVEESGEVYILVYTIYARKYLEDEWVPVAQGQWGWHFNSEYGAYSNLGFTILKKHFEVGEYEIVPVNNDDFPTRLLFPK